MLSISEEEREILKNQWYQIFDLYGYMEKINKLSTVYPDVKSLYVSFRDVSEFDNDFSLALTMDPETYLGIGEEVVKDYISTQRRNSAKRVNLRLVDVPDKGIKIDIRNIRSQNIGNLISISGIVRKNTEVLPRLQIAGFVCSNCGEITYMMQDRGRLDEPSRCEFCEVDRNKARFKVRLEESEFVDVQKIEIQENPETLDGGSQPQRITVVLEDDLTGKIFPGDRITINGTIKAEQKRAGSVLLTEFDIYLFAINFKKDSKEVEDIKISDEDERNIVDLSKDPKIIEKLSQSIAPTIYGHDMIKTSLVLQMFGGVRKTMKDGTTMRGDIHILMVGDPGTAKSQLLKYMTEISPRSVFAFGRGSSAAGLTAAAIRDDFGEGRWTLEAGALVLADNGFAAIDELDKMDEHDTAAMHEAMEQQTVTISKAGIMATLKSRCSILGAANPKFGRYDPNRSIVEQIDFPPPLISRFDVIFKIIDRPNVNTDQKLADHILRAHRVGEIYRSLENTDIAGMKIEEEESFDPPIDKDTIRKYVSYARSRTFPRLSDEAIQVLRDEYVKTRNVGGDSIPITARQLESTIRLAEAAAKARLSPIVTAGDATLAKTIVDFYLKDVSMNNGVVDIDILLTGMSSGQRTDAETVYDIIKELKREKKRAPSIQDVADRASSKGMSKDKVTNSIAKLKAEGFIYSPDNDKKVDVAGRD